MVVISVTGMGVGGGIRHSYLYLGVYTGSLFKVEAVLKNPKFLTWRRFGVWNIFDFSARMNAVKGSRPDTFPEK